MADYHIETQALMARVTQAEAEVRFCQQMIEELRAVLAVVKDQVPLETRAAIEVLEP